MSADAASRLRAQGAAATSVPDLLAVALARREADVAGLEERSRRFLQSLGGIAYLNTITAGELASLAGLEEFERLRIEALLELSRRAARAGRGELPSADQPETVAAYLSDLETEKREHFVVLLLNAKNQIERRVTVHMGTVDQSLVGPREVFREAVRDGAASVIVAHNHPSGDPEPSPEDIHVTRQLCAAGRLLDIHVLDHVIIGHNGRWTSLRRSGML